MSKIKKVIFKPIGFVKSDFKNPKDTIVCCEKGLKATNISKIEIFGKYIKGLSGIEKFLHIFVLYYFNKIKKSELVTYPGPLSIKNLPQVGIFACRSQYRPNPIALRLVKLIKKQNNELIVKGLDAINNSPVLDIKPYVTGFDRPNKFKEASWYQWLNK